jgi:hypothetical protein
MGVKELNNFWIFWNFSGHPTPAVSTITCAKRGGLQHVVRALARIATRTAASRWDRRFSPAPVVAARVAATRRKRDSTTTPLTSCPRYALRVAALYVRRAQSGIRIRVMYIMEYSG